MGCCTGKREAQSESVHTAPRAGAAPGRGGCAQCIHQRRLTTEGAAPDPRGQANPSDKQPLAFLQAHTQQQACPGTSGCRSPWGAQGAAGGGTQRSHVPPKDQLDLWIQIFLQQPAGQGPERGRCRNRNAQPGSRSCCPVRKWSGGLGPGEEVGCKGEAVRGGQGD